MKVSKSKIQICIYVFAGDRFLDKCIDSIISSHVSNDVVVDLYVYAPNSNDVYKSPYNNVLVSILRSPKNYAEVTNLSLKKAQEGGVGYFMLLNSDTILHKSCIENLVSFSKAKKGFVVLGGYQTRYPDQWDKVNEWTLQQENDAVKIGSNKGDYIETSYVQGACMLFKMSLVSYVGFFDERFGLFYEETEFCRRAKKIGDIAIVKSARVGHYAGGTWKKNWRLSLKRDIYYLSNQIIYESTDEKKDYLQLLIDMSKKIWTQLKVVILKQDGIKMNVFLYPLVVVRLVTKLNLITDLKRFQDE